MKILSAQQIREGDAYTIKHEPISSVDLMERAGERCFQWIYDHAPKLFPEHLDEREYTFKVFCGVGNNGGDGLVIARLLSRNGYDVEVFIIAFSDQESPDFKANFKRLGKSKMPVHRITNPAQIPDINADTIVVDAIFGTGISRKAEGIAAKTIAQINASGATVISIDMPSGLFDEDNSTNNSDGIVRANYTLTFQFLKPAFLFGENSSFVGTYKIIDIGLHQDFINAVDTSRFLVTKSIIKSVYRPRKKFAHKGDFGHAAIFAGSKGKYGAAILATRGALHAGSGLVTAMMPSSGVAVMQTAVPEAMVQQLGDGDILEGKADLSPYAAFGIGPGLDMNSATQKLVSWVLKEAKVPVVIDADAINALANHSEWCEKLHTQVILTPHPGEFKRLAGSWNHDYERLAMQVQWAKDHQCYLLLKGAHSTLATPEGEVFFNSTGNPGMATGGSGDVLTGILTGLLAQGYSLRDAALMGMYLHGKSGDLAVKESGPEAMIASDLVRYLGKAFLSFNLRSN